MSPIKFIDIAPGLSILPTHVAAVKDAGDGRATIFLQGTGALDGFVVERDWRDVVEELDVALERQEENREDANDEDDEADEDEDNDDNNNARAYTHTAVNAHGHRIGTPDHGRTWHDAVTGKRIA